MPLTSTNDFSTFTSNTNTSVKSAFQNIPKNEEKIFKEETPLSMKIGSNKSAFTTICNPDIDSNKDITSMEIDNNNINENKKQLNKPENINIKKNVPPKIFEQGPSDPSTPVDVYKDGCKDKSPFLTVDAMQRINLLSPSYAIDINKLCPNYQANYATSDLGSSTRSSFSISPTTVQLNSLFTNFRDSKRSTDYDTDSDYCSKDLLSPYSAFSPSPFNSSETYPELPETPYSGFVSNDGRSPILSPLPFNSSNLSLHFNFDGQQQRSTSSLSTSWCQDEISNSQQLFYNLLSPNNLTAISRERSKSEGEMLAESLNAFSESNIMSTLNMPTTQHKHRSKIIASNNIKKEHRIRNCYSPQTHYLEKNFLKPKYNNNNNNNNSNLSTNIWNTISSDNLFGNRSSSTPPPTTKESATLDAAILAKEAATYTNASNFLLPSKSALNLNTLDKSLPQFNFNNITSTNNWLESQLQAINRAISVNNISQSQQPSTSLHVPQISQPILPPSQLLSPSMGNYTSQLLALSLLQNNPLSISKSHSENNLSTSKPSSSHSTSQKSTMIDNKQTSTLSKPFPEVSSITTPLTSRLTPTKTSLIPPIGAIPISCGNEAYVCSICGQAFALADRLAKHIASRHKDPNIDPITIEANKIHKCNQCGKKFGRSDMLTRHLRLHTGVKPYSCNICGQVFSRSDHLSTHQRTHTGEKPYQCPQCNYAASRRDMITRHLRIHSKTEENMSAEMISRINISQPTSNFDKEQLNIKTTLDVPTISLSSPMDTNSISNEEEIKNKAKIIFKSSGDT